MASVFKRAMEAKKPNGKWTGAYKDEVGTRRYFQGSTDRGATLAEAQVLERNARLMAKGLADPKKAKYVANHATPIEKFVDEYDAHLTAKGDTRRHIVHTCNCLRNLCEIAGIASTRDYDAQHIADGIEALCSDKSARTRNFARQAALAFATWLYDTDRIRDAVKGRSQIPRANEDADTRLDRRPLTADELGRLIEAAQRGKPQRITRNGVKPIIDLDGPTRALIYSLAVGTGLRAGEIRALTPAHFDLDPDAPIVRIDAVDEKARRGAKQPIPRDLVPTLREYLMTRPTDRPAFDLPEKTAEMIRRDMGHAGIAYANRSGQVVDFHSLRVTFVTRLILDGKPLAIVQKLARHSTPELTANIYTKLSRVELNEVINPTPPTSESRRAGDVRTTPKTSLEPTKTTTKTPKVPKSKPTRKPPSRPKSSLFKRLRKPS